MDPDAKTTTGSPESGANLGLQILYEEGGLVALDKPWDLPSTGRNLEDPDCLQYSLIQHFGGMVWAIHQLDADTTGVNLFVREKGLVAHWKERMGFPGGTKTYLAIVHGRVDFQHKRIDAPIGLVSREPVRQLGICPDGKRAVSEVRCLGLGLDASLLQIQIETGRTHQIRIHLGSIGHPLFGEEWYAEGRPREHPRQALHAWRVAFGPGVEPREIESPLAPDLVGLLNRLGIDAPERVLGRGRV